MTLKEDLIFRGGTGRLPLTVTMSDGKTRSGDKLSLECAIDPVKQYGQWRIQLNAYWDDECFRQRQMVDVVAVVIADWGQEVARFEVGPFCGDNGRSKDWSFDVALTCDMVSDELYDLAKNFRMALSFAS
ncbi:MAG: hypothetical protein K6F57_03295 [Candidatus Saccharibacteria bacterium]|nr:hypothetical protein [Candidatus Saccharibacteria bacterium]